MVVEVVDDVDVSVSERRLLLSIPERCINVIMAHLFVVHELNEHLRIDRGSYEFVFGRVVTQVALAHLVLCV